MELHEGDCGSHSSGKRLVLRAKRAGYYWPTMAEDANKKAKHCDSGKRYAPVSKLPPENLKSISSPWPFRKWGIVGVENGYDEVNVKIPEEEKFFDKYFFEIDSSLRKALW